MDESIDPPQREALLRAPPEPELAIDIRDRTGRLVRFGLAVAFGLVATYATMSWIDSVSGPPNKDPVGSGSVGLLAIAIFVVTATFGLAVITKLSRRLRRRAR